jgi:hypothetical protein
VLLGDAGVDELTRGLVAERVERLGAEVGAHEHDVLSFFARATPHR